MMTSFASNDTARAIATICWMAVEKFSSGSRTSTLHVEAGQQRGGLGIHLGPVEQAESRARLAAEKDVLGHRAVADQVDLLEDRADAGTLRLLRRARGPRRAIERDRSRIAAHRRR